MKNYRSIILSLLLCTAGPISAGEIFGEQRVTTKVMHHLLETTAVAPGRMVPAACFELELPEDIESVGCSVRAVVNTKNYDRASWDRTTIHLGVGSLDSVLTKKTPGTETTCFIEEFPGLVQRSCSLHSAQPWNATHVKNTACVFIENKGMEPEDSLRVFQSVSFEVICAAQDSAFIDGMLWVDPSGDS